MDSNSVQGGTWVAGSIPSLGAYKRQPIDASLKVDVSLSLLLSNNNEKIVLRGGLKKKKRGGGFFA